MGAQARLLTLAIFASGCTCDPTVAQGIRFACTSSDECAAGNVCTQGECQPAASSSGGGAGGGVATGGGNGGGSGGGGTGGSAGGGAAGGGAAGGGATGGGTGHLPAVALTVVVNSPAPAGHCVPVELGLLDANGTSTLADAALQVTLTADSSLLNVFSDSQCTASAQQVSFVAGDSNAQLFVQTPTGIDYQLSAIAPGLADAGTTLSVTPVVRTVSCSFAAGDTSIDCPVAPPVRALSDSFLVLQVVPSGNSAGALEARCDLVQVDDVKCSRNASGIGLDLLLQVAELDQVLVQRVSAQCDGGTVLASLATSVDPAATLFFSSQSNGGVIIDQNDFSTSDLVDAGAQVTYDFGGGCTGNIPMIANTQVVTFGQSSGVNVSHAVHFMAAGTDVITRTAIADAGLLMWRERLRTGNPGVCDRTLRGEIDSANGQVHYSRGNGAPLDGGCYDVNLNIHSDQADLGPMAQVQQVSFSVNPQEPSRAVSLPNGVDTTRTLVFSGGDGPFGQSSGETDYDTDAGPDCYPGEMAAGLVLDAGALFSQQVLVTRGASDGGARFSFFAVELNP